MMVSGLSLKIVMIIVYRLLQVSNETPPTCIYIYKLHCPREGAVPGMRKVASLAWLAWWETKRAP